MPCYDAGADRDAASEERAKRDQQLKRVEAMLCETVRMLNEYDRNWLTKYDIENTERSGITAEELQAWITDHAKQDAARRQQMLQQLLETLTIEQLDVLEAHDDIIARAIEMKQGQKNPRRRGSNK
jgi:arsenate reductase-like glutaredoxin family protein